MKILRNSEAGLKKSAAYKIAYKTFGDLFLKVADFRFKKMLEKEQIRRDILWQ